MYKRHSHCHKNISIKKYSSLPSIVLDSFIEDEIFSPVYDAAALQDAEWACIAAPGWPKAYFRHGNVRMKRGAYTKAYGVFKQAWHLDTSNAEVTKACQVAREAMLGLDGVEVDEKGHVKPVRAARARARRRSPTPARGAPGSRSRRQ